METLTCFQKCFEGEDCIDEVKQCKENELCFAVIGFKGNNISTPEIRFANCYTGSNCKKSNLSICVAEYEADFPFVRDYFCCCNQSVCNKNYELKPIQTSSRVSFSSTITNNLNSNFHSDGGNTSGLGLTFTTIVLFLILIVISTFIIILILLILKQCKTRKIQKTVIQGEEITKKREEENEMNEQTEKFLSISN